MARASPTCRLAQSGAAPGRGGLRGAYRCVGLPVCGPVRVAARRSPHAERPACPRDARHPSAARGRVGRDAARRIAGRPVCGHAPVVARRSPHARASASHPIALRSWGGGPRRAGAQYAGHPMAAHGRVGPDRDGPGAAPQSIVLPVWSRGPVASGQSLHPLPPSRRTSRRLLARVALRRGAGNGRHPFPDRDLACPCAWAFRSSGRVRGYRWRRDHARNIISLAQASIFSYQRQPCDRPQIHPEPRPDAPYAARFGPGA